MKQECIVITEIESLNLNDSEIKEIRIKELNRIEIDIQLISSYDTQESVPCRLVFSDCQNATLDLNMAYEGGDTIRSGTQASLDDVYREYHIETNTSASMVRIVAKRLSLLKLGESANG